VQFIPYRGAGPAMTDLVSGQVDLLVVQGAVALPQIRGGKIKALANLSPQRSASMPDIPTADETGVPGLYMSGWFGFWAPKGTPKDVIDKMEAELQKAFASDEIKNLWKMFVLRVPLVIGTAQNLDYAEESWDKAVEIVEGIPELAVELSHVDRTNGKKAFKLTHGSRWKIAAASRKGGRSLSADDVNLDELREHHSWESWGAVTKTTMARRKAQIWAFSNAGDDRSVVLNDLREKAIAALDDPDTSLGIMEWSAPDDCPIDDPQGLRQANPALGYPQGISMEALEAAMETDPEPVFRTECLCQRVPDLVPSKIPLTAWIKCADAKSSISDGLVLSWEVSWRRDWASIAVAGYRDDGLPHVELIEYREGTEWLAGRFGELAKRHSVLAVVFNPTGPGASLLTEVTERLPVKLEPKPMTARDQANACGQLYDAVTIADAATGKGQLRQLGDDRLRDMLRTSATRTLVDAWAWDLRNSLGEISGLCAITNAFYGLTVYGQPRAPAPLPMMAVLDAKDRFATDMSDVMTIGF